MAGHNKWSKVKHIKEKVDAKKGKVFSKLSRELTLAAKSGGDPDMNPRLRSAILAAKAVNMPSDNIERAIKKGTGELAGDVLEEALYEGFGPGGVALLVEVVTDNKNRSLGDIRTTLNKNGGSIGSSGSVSFLFERKGEIKLPAAAGSEDAIMELAMDAGADDVASDPDEHTILTAPDKLYAVCSHLKEKGSTPETVRLVYLPQNCIQITDAATAAQVLRVCDALDDLDDTQNVFGNFDIPDEILEQLNT
ncbi:MAG: YebC/PmpR family DNA-binding transcriptional regulator [Verrucomicrobiales bacterium]|nr:YebC/PmpR family DNA-binding transcriptional regulator [Verrucomicrobiales bacterium]